MRTSRASVSNLIHEAVNVTEDTPAQLEHAKSLVALGENDADGRRGLNAGLHSRFNGG